MPGRRAGRGRGRGDALGRRSPSLSPSRARPRGSRPPASAALVGLAWWCVAAVPRLNGSMAAVEAAAWPGEVRALDAQFEAGRRQLGRLEEGRAAEARDAPSLPGGPPRAGKGCYEVALDLAVVDGTACRRLDSVAKARLAVHFANCHVHLSGQPTHPCPGDRSIAACTAGE